MRVIGRVGLAEILHERRGIQPHQTTVRAHRLTPVPPSGRAEQIILPLFVQRAATAAAEQARRSGPRSNGFGRAHVWTDPPSRALSAVRSSASSRRIQAKPANTVRVAMKKTMRT